MAWQSVLSLDSLFLQAYRSSEEHLQEALEEPLAALVDVQLIGKQWEAVVLQEFLLLLLEGSAEIGIQQLGKRGSIIWGNLGHCSLNTGNILWYFANMLA